MQIHFEINTENERGLADSIRIVRLFNDPASEKTLPVDFRYLQQLL